MTVTQHVVSGRRGGGGINVLKPRRRSSEACAKYLEGLKCIEKVCGRSINTCFFNMHFLFCSVFRTGFRKSPLLTSLAKPS